MIWLIYKKDMKSFFRNPVGYLIAGLFCLIVGWLFLHQLDYFVNNIQKGPAHLRNHFDFTNEVIIKLFSNINFLFLFIAPIIGMKSFSQEMKDKTIELYYSAPISDFELIIGKLMALFSQGLFLLSLTIVYPLVLGSIEISDASFIYCGYLGLFLNLISFLSICLFASSLSTNQMIVALIAFAMIMGLWITGFFAQASSNYLVSSILNYLSINYHLSNFLKGVIRLSDLSYYSTLIVTCIFLTKKRLEARMW